MIRFPRFLAAALLGLIASAAWLAAQQAPTGRGAQAPAAAPSAERAQDQRPTSPDSPFSLLPGFSVVRVTPDTKTDSLIVVTFDSLGRPVVSQSASGSGDSPRILIDKDGDGLFEGEQVVSTQINTCHGLFYD